MKSRFLHLAMLALGAAGVVLTFLGSVPKYAGIAAGLLLLVTDAKKALGALGAPDATKPTLSLIALLLIGHAFAGCATTSAITKACKPSTTDETQAVTTLWNDPSRTTAETVAILEGGKIAYCVISQLAQDVLMQESMSTPKLATTLFATTLFALPPEPSLQASRAQAWLTVHP